MGVSSLSVDIQWPCEGPVCSTCIKDEIQALVVALLCYYSVEMCLGWASCGDFDQKKATMGVSSLPFSLRSLQVMLLSKSP